MNLATRITLRACIILALCAACAVDAAATERLPQGTPVLADGAIGDVEWEDAGVFPVALSASVSVTVLAKHDGTNLLAAFVSDLNPNRTLFMPEIVLDTAFDRAASWQTDDWWFHVSASDCQARGRWADYSNCQIVQPDWIGVPNYPMHDPSPALIERFEISIPLSKLGLAVGDTFGLAFTAEFIPNQRAIWPATASMNQPGTWAEVILCDGGCPATGASHMSLGQVKALYR